MKLIRHRQPAYTNIVRPGEAIKPKRRNAAAAPPLDGVTSAVLAFSAARRLRTGYSGPALRVRRSLDSAEQDIGFTDAGALDEPALLAFVGGGNGFVVTLYDQSGHASAVNRIQPAAAAQARIVSDGAIERVGGKAALHYVLGNERAYADAWSTRPAVASFLVALQHSGRSFVALGANGGVSSVFMLAGDENSGATSINSGVGAPTFRVDGAAFLPATRGDVYAGIVSEGAVVVRADSVALSNADFVSAQTGYRNAAPLGAPVREAEFFVCTNPADAAILEANVAAFYGVPLA